MIDRLLFQIRKTTMGEAVPTELQWSCRDIITSRVPSMRSLAPPLFLDDDFSFDSPKVAGRQLFPSFPPEWLHEQTLRLQFTTQRCQRLSGHISNCPTFSHWLGSPILSFLSSSSSFGFSHLPIPLRVPSRAPRRTFLPVVRPQRVPLHPPQAFPGTWPSQQTSSSPTPSMELLMVQGMPLSFP